MNKERRKRVDAIIDALENLKGDIEEVLEEETEYRDNIISRNGGHPPSVQVGNLRSDDGKPTAGTLRIP